MSYASKEQLKQILQKIDDNFARKDGYYTNMAVGNAENLISPDGVLDTPENDTEYNPLLFRTTAGDKSVSDGVATANKIRGKSYKWNQLLTRAFEPNASSSISTTNNIVKVTSNGSAYYFGAVHSTSITGGHKYFVQFNIKEINVQNLVKIQIGNWGRLSDNGITSTGIHNGIVVADNTSTVTYINAQCSGTSTTDDNFSFTDFMLADLTSIYGSGNEPTTVDQFLVDYPMFNSYVPYTEGSIAGVKATNIQTVGFNAFNPTTGKAFLLGGNEYQITGAYTALSYSTGETITTDADGKFTPAKNGELTVTGGNDTTTCVHLTWSGYRNGEYEAYWKQSIATRISDYFTDGMHGVGSAYDELTSTRVIKRFGIVNLGTLDWTYNTSSSIFQGLISDLKAPESTADRLTDILCSKYPISSVASISSSMTDQSCMRYSDNINSYIIVRDTSFTSVTSFRDAMAGVYLIYELATPVETPIDPPINFNYRVSDFGTEEFTYEDGDVQVNVPCELFYQNNLVGKLRNINDLTASELEEVINGLG